MLKANKYLRKTKTSLASAKNQLRKVGKSKYAKDKKVWLATVIAVLAVVFWLLPAYGAKAPGQLGYAIKRGEEFLVSNLAPLSSWRDSLHLDFANNRVFEVAYVANQADKNSRSDQAKTAATINNLLETYEKVYQARTAALNQKLTDGKKSSKADLLGAQKNAVTTYDDLQLLRLQAPDGAQLAVLGAIDDTQRHLATLNDALGAKPLSASDLSQLAKLVPIGIITKAQADQLTSIKSSRQLHDQLVEMINNGQLPSDITYILDQDLIKQVDPAHATSFGAVAEFEQMQRISSVIAASRPTSTQQSAIQTYIASYQPGQTIPADSIQPYVTPIVYGIALSGRLLNDLSSLKTLPMSSDDQALLNSWKKIIDPPNLSDIYQKLMTSASSDPQLALRNLIRMQQELVDGQKAQVSYLVMPPGWGTNQLGNLNNQMAVQIATDQLQASKPDANQELASVSATQAQLQSALDSLKTTHADNITQLQTKISSFSGTPDQLSQLKSDLAALDQSQTTTINNLQAQLSTINDARSRLGDAITSLRQEQITNLTTLELRAATNAQSLTSSAKTELTSALNKIEQTSQTLIGGLQSQVDGLGVGQTQLRQQLTAELQTVRSDYIGLIGTVQGQIDAGAAATTQLATTLQTVQTDLSAHTTQLSTLASGASALTTLVGQVQTSAGSQAASLQSQIDGLKVDQQTVKTSINDLRTQQSNDITQLTSQLAGLSVLQAEAQAVITTISQEQAQARTDINNLTNSFTTLQTAFDASQQTQTALQATIADQNSALGSLQTQTQSALDTLNAQASQLASQVSTLTTNATNLSQTVTTIQNASATTQTQLNTLLANPPWAIAAGTYVTQSEFDSLSAAINTQFAQKSAALDAQFQSYQQTLNTSVSQINSQVQSLSATTAATAASQTQLSQTVGSLTSRIQTLETRVQQLINAATPPGGL